MLFSPTIGAAITAGRWFLWVRYPACRTTRSVDLRTLDRHPDAAWGPNAHFAELDVITVERCRGVLRRAQRQ